MNTPVEPTARSQGDPIQGQRIEILLRCDVAAPVWYRATADGKMRKWDCRVDDDQPAYYAGALFGEGEIAAWRPLGEAITDSSGESIKEM